MSSFLEIKFAYFFQVWVFYFPSFSVATFGNFTMPTHCFIWVMNWIPHGKYQLYAFSFSFWASEISSQLPGPFLPKSEKPIWDYSRWGSPGWTSTFGIIANQCSSPNRWLKKWKELSGEAILVWAQLVSVKSLRNPSKMWKTMNKIAFFSRFLYTVCYTFFYHNSGMFSKIVNFEFSCHFD